MDESLSEEDVVPIRCPACGALVGHYVMGPAAPAVAAELGIREADAEKLYHTEPCAECPQCNHFFPISQRLTVDIS